jgi:hypothetical protein
MQKLQLRQQLGLASMVLQCPWLREVDLTECELLTDTVCNVFSDGGGCPRLNSLTLDNCDGLTRVKLSSSSLSTLSLAGCRNILSLELSCPILQRLQLEGCDRLMDASFSPVHFLLLSYCIINVFLSSTFSLFHLAKIHSCDSHIPGAPKSFVCINERARY